MKELFQNNIILKNHCTYKIGGPAKYFFEPETLESFGKVYEWSLNSNTPLLVIGFGSNLLISDDGFNGLVISTRKLDDIILNNTTINVSCGANLSEMVIKSCKNSLSGLEKLYGIPGSVGGAVFMNAGAFGVSIGDHVTSVKSIMKDGTVIKKYKDELGFGYRTSLFKNENEIILSVELNLQKGQSDALLKTAFEIEKKRAEKQPKEKESCGSVFKRPKNSYAGTLIEKCGLKGMRVGGAVISEKHANFIINDKNATATDVKSLIEKVQIVVKERENILLEPEVVFVP